MISKELLSEILRKDILGVREHSTSILYSIDYETEEDGELIWIVAEFFINIYELAHKCKEWAFLDGWMVHERKSITGEYEYSALSNKGMLTPTFDNIFDLCQWLLDNK